MCEGIARFPSASHLENISCFALESRFQWDPPLGVLIGPHYPSYVPPSGSLSATPSASLDSQIRRVSSEVVEEPRSPSKLAEYQLSYDWFDLFWHLFFVFVFGCGHQMAGWRPAYGPQGEINNL